MAAGQEKRLTVVLFGAGIEIPPPEIRDHPAILADARRRGRKPDSILLYVARHRFAMDRLEDFERRGRPDIAHRALLALLDSPLNRMGMVRPIVETIEGRVFELSPDVRLPKDYYQFEGLMVQLLKTGRVPPEGEPLIWMLDESLESVVADAEVKVLLSEEGERVRLDAWRELVRKKAALLIGAYQKGSPPERIYKLADKVWSVSKHSLMTTSVVCRAMAYLELAALAEGFVEEI